MKPTDNIVQLLTNMNVTPDPDSDRQKLDAVLRAQAQSHLNPPADLPPNRWRTIMENRITKLTTAAAAVLIAGVIIFSLVVSPKVTFADVIKPLFEADTFAYDLVFGGEEGPVVHDRVSGNRIRRTTSDLPNMVLIIDADAAKILRLDTAGQAAALIDIAGPLEQQARHFIALVRETIERQMADPDFEPAEPFRRQIDGRKVVGYSLGDDRQRVTILADADTGAPMQIELDWGRESVILRNFEFNIPIPEDQVSMNPPAGYTMHQTQMDLSNLSDQDLIESLRVWAEYLRDGTFPPQLLKQEYVKQIPLLREKLGPLPIPDEEKEKMGRYFIQGMMYLQILNEMEWHYAGAGVRLGDASTPILWYRPQGSETWRVIYGDLRVEEAASDQLPQ